MANLAFIQNKLLRRLNAVDSLFLSYIKQKNKPRNNIEDWLKLEGYINIAWQYWGNFCRNIVINSATGCTTQSGNLISAAQNLAPCTWERVSYIAKQSAFNKPIQAEKINNILRLEPTWGDITKLPLIINAINPENKTTLLSGFGVATKIRDVQIIRNASAHRNVQTLREVTSLAPRYKAFRIYHPSEAALWQDIQNNDFAFLSWTDEMRLSASLVTT